MSSETNNYSELRRFRIWIAIGAVGLLLTGIGMSASLMLFDDIYAMAIDVSDGSEAGTEDFGDTASEFYDTAQLGKLEELIGKRQAEPPNDGEVYWWNAKLHIAREEYPQALRLLDSVQLHIPGWTEEHIDPLREAVRVAMGSRG